MADGTIKGFLRACLLGGIMADRLMVWLFGGNGKGLSLIGTEGGGNEGGGDNCKKWSC